MTGGDDVNPDRYRAEPAPETKAADPARDDFEIALISAAVRDDRPMLCICRGIQVLNVALGGTLQQHYDGHFDLPNYNEGIHDVHLEPGSMLAKVMGATQVAVNSLHHQASTFSRRSWSRSGAATTVSWRESRCRDADSRSACSGTPSCYATGPNTSPSSRRSSRRAPSATFGHGISRSTASATSKSSSSA